MEGRPPDEPQLVSRARAGDAQAFGELVALHQEVAFRVAFLVLGDAAEAEDAAQEAFVRAFRALGRFRTGEPFRPWLLRITANQARNRRRSAVRREGLRLRVTEGWTDAAAPSAESTVVDDERRRELLAAINALPLDDRIVLGARYFLDLSEAETAAVIGAARGTVKSRLSRARTRLHQRLDAAGWRTTDDG